MIYIQSIVCEIFLEWLKLQILLQGAGEEKISETGMSLVDVGLIAKLMLEQHILAGRSSSVRCQLENLGC